MVISKYLGHLIKYLWSSNREAYDEFVLMSLVRKLWKVKRSIKKKNDRELLLCMKLSLIPFSQ